MGAVTSINNFPQGRSYPIINASEIGPGKQFPPERERDRINNFDKWYNWSQRNYTGFYTTGSQLRFDISRQMTRLSPNLFRFVMEFWADAIATDVPIVTYKSGQRQQDFIDKLMPALMRASKLVVADMVRYGCGVLWSKDALAPQAIDPRFWYPIRPADDHYDYQGDVLAMPYSSLPTLVNDKIVVYNYPKDGQATKIIYDLDGLTIKKSAGKKETIAQDSEGMVVPIRSREGVYGTSDFIDMEEYVQELHRRESSISEALDNHTKPHLSVPEGSLKVNDDGSVTIEQDGMVIPVPEGGGYPQYIVWDAKFEAQENSIVRAEQRILRMSSIAPILASPGDFTLKGSLPSGAALRRLAVISVNRLKSIREELSTAWRRVIPAQAKLYAGQGGELISIDADNIDIEWPPEFSTVDDEVLDQMEGKVNPQSGNRNSRPEVRNDARKKD